MSKSNVKAAGKKESPAKKRQARKATEPAKQAKVSPEELAALQKPVDEAKSNLEKAQVEAEALAEKARALVTEAKGAYAAVLAPYRVACRKADVECEYEGGRGANVTEKVFFLVEKTEKGVRVMVRGRPDTEELIPLAAFKESANHVAHVYAEKWCGPKAKVGNKAGSLSNRLRAVLA